jgi:hypothetical protein
MRVDRLAFELDTARPGMPLATPVPASELFARRDTRYRFHGRVVARTFGVLVQNTTSEALSLILSSNLVGRQDAGLWLCPHPYAACMVPSNLGLGGPRDIALLIDVENVPEIWGPGRAVPSSQHPVHWVGGGVEFYVPTPLVAQDTIVDVISLEPCGDRHG